MTLISCYLSWNLLVFMCICMNLCMYMCKCMCMNMCMHMCSMWMCVHFPRGQAHGSEVKVGHLHILNSVLIFWNKVSHWTWVSQLPVGRIGSNLRILLSLPLSHSSLKYGSWRLGCWHTQYLHQDQWFKLRSSHLCSKYFIWYAAATAVNRILYTRILWNHYQI